jgi:mannose-6-phosphate isomerase-like protein (cupin superfamily)
LIPTPSLAAANKQEFKKKNVYNILNSLFRNHLIIVMKKHLSTIIVAVLFFVSGIFVSVFARQKQQAGYILEHEKDLAKDEPAPHNGGGNSTVYNFFMKADSSKLVFRKRVLHPGAAIGYHLQKEEEIYYIFSGTGKMMMNDKTFDVKTGDAILTFAGSSHGLKQTGTEDLVVIIDYEKHGD